MRNIRGKYSAILWLGNFWPGIRVKFKNWWRRIIDITRSHHIDHYDDDNGDDGDDDGDGDDYHDDADDDDDDDEEEEE